MKRVQIIVSGKVQGVFYRNTIKQEANKLGVQGYAVNKPDGTVKIVADLDEKTEKPFLKACWKGSMMAFVKSVDVSASDHEEDFDGFDVR